MRPKLIGRLVQDDLADPCILNSTDTSSVDVGPATRRFALVSLAMAALLTAVVSVSEPEDGYARRNKARTGHTRLEYEWTASGMKIAATVAHPRSAHPT